MYEENEMADENTSSAEGSAATMGSLVLAGESIYALPWYLRRDFHKPLMRVFGLTNTQLGLTSSLLGIVALVSYGPGGWLADRFAARRLLVMSLLATAAGGLYMATIPSFRPLISLYGVWGVTSILLFWSALIKATRAWGGRSMQGRAFGILEGGRGVVSALLGLAAVSLFSSFEDDASGLKWVILAFSAASVVSALAVWVTVPERAGAAHPPHEPTEKDVGPSKRPGQLARVVRMPQVWLIAFIVLTGYVAYWSTFDFAAFSVDAYGLSEVTGGRLSAMAQFGRPVAALAAGWLADRVTGGRTVLWAFGVLTLALVVFAVVPGGPDRTWLLWTTASVIALASFALRAVFYALLQEGAIPLELTGTAVGIVSLVGYSGDAFVPLLQGVMLDRFPGAMGHRYFFALLAGAALLGWGISLAFVAYRAAQERTLSGAPAALVEPTGRT
jgi:sugar phosphate permease